MITPETIHIVKERLIEHYNPIEIYLVGSYAWGKPDEHSDLDLLIVVDEYNNTPHYMLVSGHRALRGLNISKDILLFTKEVFERDALHKSTICYKVKTNGIRLYEKHKE